MEDRPRQTPAQEESSGGSRRRYGLFGVSAYPQKSGMDDKQRKSMVRWANAVVAFIALAVVALVVVGTLSSAGLTVTFDTQGGSEAAIQSIQHGGKATPPEAVVRPGYTLAGWSVTPDGSEPWNFEEDTVTQPLTLYAIWVPEGAQS
ncbi:InlB B-repeat-containing protein [uncultured Flavonifractor sp.]|uniref:InlB B-repeat-containing protein n=1 Tax=uncultured Flavonifractor sp. TaxID=1193534 RepID=UPI00260A71DB|nr:InlB B-repeat-containing protein [uncultured Flavonifractor sp.]